MKDDRLYLHHMVERCHRILRFIEPGREVSMGSDELQDAVIRNLEVIGEAAKRVSPATRAGMPSVDWRAVCGLRDVLIHDYIGVSALENYLDNPSRLAAGVAGDSALLAGEDFAGWSVHPW